MVLPSKPRNEPDAEPAPERRAAPPSSSPTVRVIPLGGLGEIGRNMMVIESGEDMIIVDVGILFPEEDMHGVDLVLPDFTYVRENAHRLRGIFLTHGHEDHIGALGYLLREIHAPVYGATLTIGLVRVKLGEHRLAEPPELHVVELGEAIECGELSVEFFSVAHSIPDACGLIINTPLGPIVHTGDFKLDHTPVMDQHTDLIRLAEVGAQGCLLLLADSTYAEEEGYTPSEQIVGVALRNTIREAEGRVIVATFASLISRVQQVVDAAVAANRKVFVTGRSMIDNTRMARQLGYIEAPEGTFVNPEEFRNLPDNRVVVITTGSQGEPTSALTRMANADHRQITIKRGDTVILSSSPIPGNETHVYRNIDSLFRLGANVIHSRIARVHVHGHASREELKILQGLLLPEYFVPVHGEYRHLIAHARLAESVGVPEGNAFVLTDGDVLEIDEEGAQVLDPVSAEYVYIDGLGIGDVDAPMLRDRAHLATDGFVVVIANVDLRTGHLTRPPEILSRGFVDADGSDQLIEKSKEVVRDSLAGDERRADIAGATHRVRDALSKFLYHETRRRPMVLPVIIES